jgi:hypothetical protein
MTKELLVDEDDPKFDKLTQSVAYEVKKPTFFFFEKKKQHLFFFFTNLKHHDSRL